MPSTCVPCLKEWTLVYMSLRRRTQNRLEATRKGPGNTNGVPICLKRIPDETRHETVRRTVAAKGRYNYAILSKLMQLPITVKWCLIPEQNSMPIRCGSKKTISNTQANSSWSASNRYNRLLHSRHRHRHRGAETSLKLCGTAAQDKYYYYYEYYQERKAG